MRALAARWLVRRASGVLDRSYRRYMQEALKRDADGRLLAHPVKASVFQARVLKGGAVRWPIAVALRIEKEAAATQMVEESWWG